ncbi:hypothetical protein Enr13x_38020 [Stieleria neptunia]|uniref:Uncharacterized protein n=1 Tax=Stieleria neptunia TaxID=2527979 RepID=A0A518HSX4_9BACT|nr:hypothetical protein [Stieleria neptunia]QDV43942.1 hypothetical protein Enr13x_38020 [Stieleria neptunia]
MGEYEDRRPGRKGDGQEQPEDSHLSHTDVNGQANLENWSFIGQDGQPLENRKSDFISKEDWWEKAKHLEEYISRSELECMRLSMNRAEQLKEIKPVNRAGSVASGSTRDDFAGDFSLTRENVEGLSSLTGRPLVQPAVDNNESVREQQASDTQHAEDAERFEAAVIGARQQKRRCDIDAGFGNPGIFRRAIAAFRRAFNLYPKARRNIGVEGVESRPLRRDS